MVDERSNLSDFLQSWTEGCVLPDDADVLDRFGIEGDDAFEFIEAFAARFAVDMSDYRWYFHHGEEGLGIGGFMFRSPDRRVKRIPITPGVLAEAIRAGRWPLSYPDHVLPKVRWDIWLNRAFIVLPLALLAFGAWGLLAS